MSIYSGFATRKQEQFYNKIIYNVISALLIRVSKFYRNQQVDENSFHNILHQQEKFLRKMEKRKYLEPKYSQLLQHFHRVCMGQDPNLQKEERKKILEAANFNRTLSVLDKEMNELKQCSQLMQKMNQNQHFDGKLMKINQRQHVRKIKKSKQKKTSTKSFLDLWSFKNQKKPQIPTLYQNQDQEILNMNRTRFNSIPSNEAYFSEKNTIGPNQIKQTEFNLDSVKNKLNKTPKFRAKNLIYVHYIFMLFMKNQMKENNLVHQTDQIVSRVVQWLDLDCYDDQYGISVEFIDISLTCKYSMNIVNQPARTKKCQKCCLVEKSILQEYGVCACGREVDEQNPIVQDKLVSELVIYLYQKYSKPINNIRVFPKAQIIQVQNSQ